MSNLDDAIHLSQELNEKIGNLPIPETEQLNLMQDVNNIMFLFVNNLKEIQKLTE